jgi:hypothetical protein
MTCPHDNISLPTTSDPDTVCADCGAILDPDQIAKATGDTTGKVDRMITPAARCSRTDETARG